MVIVGLGIIYDVLRPWADQLRFRKWLCEDGHLVRLIPIDPGRIILKGI